ncbi:MAG: [Desulfovibrio sp.]|nr:[FeFe] hydrogenase H-cluster radical SAM maturase HydE [Desulfovibrio sp.]
MLKKNPLPKDKKLLEKMIATKHLDLREWLKLLHAGPTPIVETCAGLAQDLAQENFGHKVYVRGLIEISNFCKNECYYCGLNCQNKKIARYRLRRDEILKACAIGYQYGLRTFVLQGGEDPFFTDDYLVSLLKNLKEKYPDCALTLSLGERSQNSYASLRAAGASRYLLRHETASPNLYAKLHGPKQSFWQRINCLYQLKALGYQTGCGMMVGAPGQTLPDLALDLSFIQDFKPEMLGLGPFLPQQDTIHKDRPKGSTYLTLYLLSLCRLLLPKVLLPATTALKVSEEDGYSQGILHGCNVLMLNLTPTEYMVKYLIYDGKPAKGSLLTRLELTEAELAKIGYHLAFEIGDYQA